MIHIFCCGLLPLYFTHNLQGYFNGTRAITCLPSDNEETRTNTDNVCHEPTKNRSITNIKEKYKTTKCIFSLAYNVINGKYG